MYTKPKYANSINLINQIHAVMEINAHFHTTKVNNNEQSNSPKLKLDHVNSMSLIIQTRAKRGINAISTTKRYNNIELVNKYKNKKLASKMTTNFLTIIVNNSSNHIQYIKINKISIRNRPKNNN